MQVRPVAARRDLRRFVALPYRLHQRDPMWVPPLRLDMRDRLNRRRNPFFEHAEAEYFLAERQGRVVGRIAAIVNRLHNEIHGDRVGFFGFFECERDPEATRALLDAAAAWVRTRGMDTIRGPVSPSTNDESGLLIDGFDTPNTIMMPHNPPWYADLLEGAGCTGAKDLYVWEGGSERTGGDPIPERLGRAIRITRERLGLTIRKIRMDRFREEVDLIKELYNRCWERNWGFIPMTDLEIEHLAKQFRPIVEPEFVMIAEKDGDPIGFSLVLPDLNEILRTNRAGRLFPAIVRLLWRLKTGRYRRVRILLLGVLPQYRGKGVDAAMYQEVWATANRLDHPWGEAGWILEDNQAMNLGLRKMGFRHYKTLRLYDRPV